MGEIPPPWIFCKKLTPTLPHQEVSHFLTLGGLGGRRGLGLCKTSINPLQFINLKLN